MKAGVRWFVGLAALLVSAGLTASPALAKCHKDCKTQFARALKSCKAPCPKGNTGKQCRSSCKAAKKVRFAACKAATNPTPPDCGETSTTTTTTTTMPRFVDNGDGTVTDHQTGLIWEKKVAGSGCLHCVNDLYTWSSSGMAPDGTAFTDFLNALNGGPTGVGNCMSDDAVTVTGGFNGHCDWRLPSIVELATIVDLTAPGCAFTRTLPIPHAICIDPIFGPTGGGNYWSSTAVPGFPVAWLVSFRIGPTIHDMPGGGQGSKSSPNLVRAVRGGS